MTDCLFCRIWSKEAPATFVDEGQWAAAFLAKDPQAPTHVIVIPGAHFPHLGLAESFHVTQLMLTIQRVVSSLALKSYRVVMNTGSDAGQTIGHLHAHVLAGKPLGDIVASTAERQRDEALKVIDDAVKLRTYQASLQGFAQKAKEAAQLRAELARLRARAVRLREVANAVFVCAPYGRRKKPGGQLEDFGSRSGPWRCMDGESVDCGCMPNDSAPELVLHRGGCKLAEFEDLR